MFDTSTYHSRYFNKILDHGSTLIKESSNIKKIKSEYKFFYYLPNNKQMFFVQPFNLKLNKNFASYEMEKIKYNNLAELFIENGITNKDFLIILNHIDNFKKNTYKNNINNIKKQSKYLVLDKTKNRIKEYSEYNILFERIEQAYNYYINKRSSWRSCLSHGDLCFSNIIWIKEIDMIKFIDPRGANNKKSIFMDEYYDLAKISHSIFGGYESIIYNKKIDYSDIQNIFLDYLNTKNISLELIKVYEASLFLSMVPLHKDNKKNVKKFLNICDNILFDLGF